MPAAKQTVNCEEGVARGALILRPAHPSYWRECGRLCRHPAAGAGAPCGGGQVDEPEPPWDRVFDRVVTCVTNVEASVRSRARVAETSRSCGRRMCWSDVRPIGRTSNSVLDGEACDRGPGASVATRSACSGCDAEGVLREHRRDVCRIRRVKAGVELSRLRVNEGTVPCLVRKN